MMTSGIPLSRHPSISVSESTNSGDVLWHPTSLCCHGNWDHCQYSLFRMLDVLSGTPFGVPTMHEFPIISFAQEKVQGGTVFAQKYCIFSFEF